MSLSVKQVVTGQSQTDGAGVRLVRVISQPNTKDFDPFLMLDAFDSTDPDDYIKGFPWHPHRGIETVTYLIAGNVEHGDSLGNSGVIEDGSCQWMTAGSGIIHQEMPQPSKRMLGVQLWINLAKKDKMTRPEYRDLTADMVPKVEKEEATVRIIAGAYDGKEGATRGDYVDAWFYDVSVKPGQSFSLPTRPEDTVFAYIVDGSGTFGGADTHQSKRALLFDRGDALSMQAGNEGLRFFLFAGKPLGESIAWGGPIVMNTQEELQQAFRELREGTFTDHDADAVKPHLDYY